MGVTALIRRKGKADDRESIKLANVRGGLKLWRLYEALQMA
jgi:hypothetical protein